MTSHDVVMRVRRFLREKRIGHLGTLDPDAAGVLPVAVGQATRIVEFFAEQPKSYRGQLCLGVTTTSQDSTGQPLVVQQVPMLSREQLHNALQAFTGPIEQMPPMVSAVSVQGKRLYEYARQGIEVERAKRPVTIYEITVVDFDEAAPETIVLDVICSSGTYVRTLFHDIGQYLGCGAHMGWLIRTQSGPFAIEEALSLECLQEAGASIQLLSMYDSLAHLEAVEVPLTRLSALQQGLSQYLPQSDWVEGQWVRFHRDQQLLALGQVSYQEKRWIGQPRKVFHEGQNMPR